MRVVSGVGSLIRTPAPSVSFFPAGGHLETLRASDRVRSPSNAFPTNPLHDHVSWSGGSTLTRFRSLLRPRAVLPVNTGEGSVTLRARPQAGEGMVTGDVIKHCLTAPAVRSGSRVAVGEITYRSTRDRPTMLVVIEHLVGRCFRGRSADAARQGSRRQRSWPTRTQGDCRSRC